MSFPGHSSSSSTDTLSQTLTTTINGDKKPDYDQTIELDVPFPIAVEKMENIPHFFTIVFPKALTLDFKEFEKTRTFTVKPPNATSVGTFSSTIINATDRSGTVVKTINEVTLTIPAEGGHFKTYIPTFTAYIQNKKVFFNTTVYYTLANESDKAHQFAKNAFDTGMKNMQAECRAAYLAEVEAAKNEMALENTL